MPPYLVVTVVGATVWVLLMVVLVSWQVGTEVTGRNDDAGYVVAPGARGLR